MLNTGRLCQIPACIW